jgi:hypothetical protein
MRQWGTRQSNYQIVSNTENKPLIIKDIGPWDKFMTVTNNAEGVVEELFAAGYLNNGRRLFYYDSENELDELIHDGGKFTGFKFIGVYQEPK